MDFLKSRVYCVGILQQKRHSVFIKGHLISKCLFGAIVWTKIPTKECTLTYIFFHNFFQYFLISGMVFVFVAIMTNAPWDSIKNMNRLDTVVVMHVAFALIFMILNIIWKILLPLWNYFLSTPAPKESKPSVETSKKIEVENSPPKYSELFEPAYITIKE